MTVLGIDYAWQHPDPAAIAAAGYSFACRYLSHDTTKNLTLTEAQTLAAHGICVVANWEFTAQDMLRGYAGGVADAQLALTQATAAGMPKGRPIYFSADWDVTPAQEPTVLAYLSGADSVLGWSQVGEYGGYYPLKTALDAGATQWAWQSPAWSGGQWDGRATIRQTGTATVGGVLVDVNEAWSADYGQWQPGRLPDIAGGNMTPDQESALLNQSKQLYDGLFFGGTSMGQAPAGAPDNSLVSKLDYLITQAAKLDALTGPVDVKALATAVVTGLTPVVDAALAAGTPVDYDHLAVVVEAHLAATLAQGK